MDQTVLGAEGKTRCRWAATEVEFPHYHDTEWGFPVDDDTKLFEKICLEGFQSGLSWRTILVKRENFRTGFAGFDIDRVAAFTDADIERLLKDAGIVRHRGKIASTINNAKRAQEMRKTHGSLGAFFWRYEPDPAEHAKRGTVSTTPESVQLSKDLKKLGWSFVGPTTVYAFMQAMGMVNDHGADCFVRAQCAALRLSFKRPWAR
jgi:DNA-3-methyladenine glycosylase I